MRVISGSARGRKLLTQKGRGIIRPTGDKVKEAIFDVIQFHVPGSRVLDLFAGSGALGIEALSRGAAQAVFVDSARGAIAVVEHNLTHTGLFEKAVLLHCRYEEALEKMRGTFDFIFVDPPYKAGLYKDVLTRIRGNRLLGPAGMIIVEYDAETEFFDANIIKTKKYGNTFVSFVAGGVLV